MDYYQLVIERCWPCASFRLMPTPKLELSYRYMTAPQVRQRLGLSRYQLDVRIRRGILPAPTVVDTSGVRFFEDWVNQARAILEGWP